MNLSECQRQACPEFDRRACAGREAHIHKASFMERRLFYLKAILHCQVLRIQPFDTLSREARRTVPIGRLIGNLCYKARP